MKRLILFLIILLPLPLAMSAQKNNIVTDQYGKYLANTIILKIKPEYKPVCSKKTIQNTQLLSLFSKIGMYNLQQKFPFSNPVKSGVTTIDISTIYELKYTNSTPIEKIIFQLKQNPIVEYAEKHRIVEPLYIPDDSLLNNQYYLSKINAYDAWDVCQGDTSVVMAISDWGTDNGHEDLMYNVAYNYNDPIDGIDNDNDGYTDNFRGWNCAAGSNNPQAGSMKHGIWVSGIAAASTDNNKGIAGTGFKCRFVHLRIADAQGIGVAGYESIVYAADHGYAVINCSWGDTIGTEHYAQDIVNYAHAKNLLIVAAAGNSDNTSLHYPASFEHVFSVSGTDANDNKTNNSTFNTRVDISAPSHIIFTTDLNGYFQTGAGTSFSAPIVSGCAAILKSKYPNFTNDQIKEALKVTADNIDTIPANASYIEMLGSGRVNLFRAVSDTLPPSVVFHSYDFRDNNDQWISSGDTVFLKGNFTNYLTASSNVVVTLVSQSQFAIVLNATFNTTAIGMMDTVTNIQSPFSFKLSPSTPWDRTIKFKLTFTDTSQNYSAIQFIEFIAKKSYTDTDTSNITTTITANGNIAYNYYMLKNGSGFRFKNGYPLIFDAGLMVGNSASNVSTCIRQNNSFKILEPALKQIPSVVSDQDIFSSYNDEYASNTLNIKINQRSFAWHTDSIADFIILEYDIINNNNIMLAEMYAGIFADWDISIDTTNFARYNSEHNFSYNYSAESDGIYAGMKILSGQNKLHYAIDQTESGDGTINISDGFNTLEKFHVLTNNRHEAGFGFGIDVCDVVSAGPFSIAAQDTEKVVIALLAGENYYVLQNAAIAAQKMYNHIYLTGIEENLNSDFIIDIYPNPAKEELTIYSKFLRNSKIEIRNTLGQSLYISNLEKEKKIDVSGFNAGIYFLRISDGNTILTKKIIISN